MTILLVFVCIGRDSGLCCAVVFVDMPCSCVVAVVFLTVSINDCVCDCIFSCGCGVAATTVWL